MSVKAHNWLFKYLHSYRQHGKWPLVKYIFGLSAFKIAVTRACFHSSGFLPVPYSWFLLRNVKLYGPYPIGIFTFKLSVSVAFQQSKCCNYFIDQVMCDLKGGYCQVSLGSAVNLEVIVAGKLWKQFTTELFDERVWIPSLRL